MDISIILIILATTFTIVWAVICAVKYYIVPTKKILGDSDRTFTVQCEKCETVFQAGAKDLAKFFSKSVSIGFHVKAGFVGAGASIPSKVSKRVYCPHCNKKRWCRIQDLKEYGEYGVLKELTVLTKAFVRWIIGALIIWLLLGIPSGIIHEKQYKQDVENAERNAYEHFLETYNVSPEDLTFEEYLKGQR